MRAASQAVPPKIKNAARPSLGIFAGVIFGTAMVGAGAVVFFFNPGTNGFYPVCLFHKLTGLNCPGCGATRALYALLHGNFLLALKDNALLIFALAFLSVRSTHFAAKYFLRKPAEPFLSPKNLWTFLTVAIVFTILRNLSVFSFLSP
jgi:hypothetical protein